MAHDQLRELGFSDRQIQLRARRGWLIRLHPGVYAVGHSRLTSSGRFLAGVLSGGGGAALVDASAAGIRSHGR